MTATPANDFGVKKKNRRMRRKRNWTMPPPKRCLVELFMPAFGPSIQAESRILDINLPECVKFWRDITWAYTGKL